MQLCSCYVAVVVVVVVVVVAVVVVVTCGQILSMSKLYVHHLCSILGF